MLDIRYPPSPVTYSVGIAPKETEMRRGGEKKEKLKKLALLLASLRRLLAQFPVLSVSKIMRFEEKAKCKAEAHFVALYAWLMISPQSVSL